MNFCLKTATAFKVHHIKIGDQEMLVFDRRLIF